MSHYLRNRNGQIYFFTVVAVHRQPILKTDLGRSTLREAISKVRREAPFQITAIVLLPDHLHAIWELPPGDMDYATRWKRNKTHFTNQWRRQGGATTVRSESRKSAASKAFGSGASLSILIAMREIQSDAWIIFTSIQ